MTNTVHNTAVTLPAPNDAQFSHADRAIAIADDYVIDSPDMYSLAAEEVVEFTRIWNELETRRTSITGPLNVALKNANALFAPIQARVKAAKDLLGRRMADYQERERRRIAQENAARETLARVEREKIEAAAKVAAAAGRIEEAYAVRQTAELVSAPISTPIRSVAKVAGVSTRETWSAECLDLAALVQYVAKHPEHLNLLQVNTTALNGLARSHKDAFKIDGVRFFSKGGVAVRR